MTKKYTAADFENARFAEHEDGRTARRVESERGTVFAWSVERPDGEEDYCADEYLVDHGWVPVPTKPTITESHYRFMLEGMSLEFKAGFNDALGEFGIKIIPDPEPTNTDRLAALHKAWVEEYGGSHMTLSEYLNDHGVTAPELKDN